MIKLHLIEAKGIALVTGCDHCASYSYTFWKLYIDKH